ncbi:hypothetical protein KKC1_26940 [Calderihabitans maritimus]|uniref:Uncharacterized protein n=1 Tax=Calderihabitans maritimus TaxID=1246530 RepID=A0A1Z5HVJ2_9FIRM|nr:hypothetical protein KKC1_26940 [Calderihabitans maritimus]
MFFYVLPFEPLGFKKHSLCSRPGEVREENELPVEIPPPG